jgi:hypothetical protein
MTWRRQCLLSSPKKGVFNSSKENQKGYPDFPGYAQVFHRNTHVGNNKFPGNTRVLPRKEEGKKNKSKRKR